MKMSRRDERSSIEKRGGTRREPARDKSRDRERKRSPNKDIRRHEASKRTSDRDE